MVNIDDIDVELHMDGDIVGAVDNTVWVTGHHACELIKYLYQVSEDVKHSIDNAESAEQWQADEDNLELVVYEADVHNWRQLFED